MKNIIIVGSGEDYSKNKLKNYCERAFFIIASDGGVKTLLENGIKPDLIVGDCDSIDNIEDKKYENIEKKIFPREKDLTDSEIALKIAINKNPDIIYLFCMTGSYIDHSLANIYNLLRNYNENIEIKIITSNSEIFLIKNEKKIYNCKNKRFSLFPINNIYGLEITGSKYNFNSKNIKLTDYSVSNVFIDNEANIKLKKGGIICIIFDEGYE